MGENNNEQEEQPSSLEQKYNQAVKHIDAYKAKANAAEVAFQGCQSSASYKLGHLLIHETKSFKDVLKLFSRIKAIRGTSKYSTGKTIKKPDKSYSNTEKALDTTSSKVDKQYKNGISIILPTYKGEKTIYRVLSSLAKQDMPNELFEIIIIINGEKDDTKNIINAFSQENTNLNIRIITLDESGASLARNKGIDASTYQYILLIDDDDSVSSTYLSSMYNLASQDTIVLAQIINIDEDQIDSANLINMQILKANTIIDNPFHSCPSVLTINACKLIPTMYMKQIKFDTALKSGEDIVYFSELFSRFSFKYKIAKEAIYFRFMKQDSISRQPLSFEFNVIGRILVISNVLHSMENTTETPVQNYLKQLINSQINFINAYLREYPNEYQTVVEEIEKRELYYFPYERLYKNS
ncbi:glycosyltransferase family 2 protein [Sulfurovum sp. CS9]|uniref:glycosyltransferase family 2 protein n=1 Tax=Sulfurovum sp. CS9 TaxID=3391146 RepID=UPI0039EA58B5